MLAQARTMLALRSQAALVSDVQLSPTESSELLHTTAGRFKTCMSEPRCQKVNVFLCLGPEGSHTSGSLYLVFGQWHHSPAIVQSSSFLTGIFEFLVPNASVKRGAAPPL